MGGVLRRDAGREGNQDCPGEQEINLLLPYMKEKFCGILLYLVRLLAWLGLAFVPLSVPGPQAHAY